MSGKTKLAYKMLTALNTLTQEGRLSVRFGAKDIVIYVETTLQISPHIDNVEGVIYVGTYDTTRHQNLK